jgi:hypothetical protein
MAQVTIQVPLDLIQNLIRATQRQAACQRIVDPKPTQDDIDHANEWVMQATEHIRETAIKQGRFC